MALLSDDELWGLQSAMAPKPKPVTFGMGDAEGTNTYTPPPPATPAMTGAGLGIAAAASTAPKWVDDGTPGGYYDDGMGHYSNNGGQSWDYTPGSLSGMGNAFSNLFNHGMPGASTPAQTSSYGAGGASQGGFGATAPLDPMTTGEMNPYYNGQAQANPAIAAVSNFGNALTPHFTPENQAAIAAEAAAPKFNPWTDAPPGSPGTGFPTLTRDPYAAFRQQWRANGQVDPYDPSVNPETAREAAYGNVHSGFNPVTEAVNSKLGQYPGGHLAGGLVGGVADALLLGSLSGASGNNQNTSDPRFWGEAGTAALNAGLMKIAPIQAAIAAKWGGGALGKIASGALIGAGSNAVLTGGSQIAAGEFNPKQLAEQTALGAVIGGGPAAVEAFRMGAPKAVNAAETKLARGASPEFGGGDFTPEQLASGKGPKAPETSALTPALTKADLAPEVRKVVTKAERELAAAHKSGSYEMPDWTVPTDPAEVLSRAGARLENAKWMPSGLSAAGRARMAEYGAALDQVNLSKVSSSPYNGGIIQRLQTEYDQGMITAKTAAEADAFVAQHGPPAWEKIKAGIGTAEDQSILRGANAVTNLVHDARLQGKVAIALTEPPISPPHIGETAPNLQGASGGGVPPKVPGDVSAHPSGGGPRQEVPLGRIGIDQVIADKAATTREAGPIGRAVGQVPGVKKLAGAVNPSINLDRGIHVANQAEAAIKADLGTRFVSTRQPLLDEIKAAFKNEPEYLGPTKNPIKGTFLDIAENPHDYALSPEQSAVLAKIAARDVGNVNLVRGEFNGDVGLYTPKNPDAIYLPHINANEDLIAQGLRTEASLGAPRVAKERVWDTARERANYDSVFKPETDAAKLLTAHDNALASMAGKETFKIGSGGLNKAEAMAEKYPALAARMDALKTKLTSLKGTAGRLDSKTNDAIDTFMASGKEDADLIALQDSLRPQIGKNAVGVEGPNFGKDRVAINAEINRVKAELDTLRPLWRNANLTDRGLIQNPITYRYHTPEASDSINHLKQTSNGPIVDKITGIAETSRASALSSDASPLTIQGQLNLWRDPVSTAVGLAKMARDGGADLAGATRREPELMSRFTQARARPFGIVDPEFAAHTSLIAKLPKVGGAIGRFEEKLFEPMMRLEYEAWKRTVQLLDKTHPNETQVWRDHEAANALSKTVPGLSTVERGISPARGKIERSLLTSTSFLASPALVVKDAASGLAKISTHMSLSAASGRELIAIKHLLTIAGTIEGVSLMSAALNADNRGLSPQDAIKKALIPGSKDFMALQIHGINIPLGGPFRSALNGLTPRYRNGEWQAPDLARFALSKVAPLPRAGIDLTRNQDYYGTPMRGGDQWHQLLQSLEYGSEAFVPMSAATIPQGIRQGKDAGQIAQDVIGQAAGSNVSGQTGYDARDVLSNKMFGADYRDPKLSTLDRQAVDAANGGKVASTNPDVQKSIAAAATIREQNVKTQQQTDASYMSPGTTTPQNSDAGKKWRDDYHTLQYAIGKQYDAKDTIDPFTGKPYGSDMDKAIASWGAVLDKAKNGVQLDWNQVDAWRAANPADAALVDKYLAGKTNTDLTPAVTAYKAASKAIGDSGFFDLKDQTWEIVRAKNPAAEPYATADAYKSAIHDKIMADMISRGTPRIQASEDADAAVAKLTPVKMYVGTADAKTTVWVKANPALAVKAWQWGYLNPGKDNGEEAFLNAWLKQHPEAQ